MCSGQDNTEEEATDRAKAFYASMLTYNAGLSLVKVSILLQYRRIFTTRYMRHATLISLIIIYAQGITNIFLHAMICMPIQMLWDLSVEGKCLAHIPTYFTPAALNIFTDFAIFALPLPVIRSLQLPRRPKFIHYCIFAIGFL